MTPNSLEPPITPFQYLYSTPLPLAVPGILCASEESLRPRLSSIIPPHLPRGWFHPSGSFKTHLHHEVPKYIFLPILNLSVELQIHTQAWAKVGLQL